MNNLKITLINPSKLLFKIGYTLIDLKNNRIEDLFKLKYPIKVNKFERSILINELNLNDLLLNDYLRCLND